MKYFYTNAQLADVITERLPQGGLDWERFGFTVSFICRLQAQTMKNGLMESLLPISDEQKFNSKLGNLIALGQSEGEFYRLITEEEATRIKAEFETLRTIQAN